MQTRRAILVGGSRLMRDFIRRVIEKNADFEVFRDLDNLLEVPGAIRITNAGWIFVILAPGQKIPEDLKIELLLKNPSLRIVGLSVGEGKIQTEWITRHEKDLTTLKLDEVVRFLKHDLNETQTGPDDNQGR